MDAQSKALGPHITDLRVSVRRSSTVVPADSGGQRRSMFLSNIDQVLNFDVDTIHFFSANPDFPPEAASEALEAALQKLLVPYDFLAGRLRYNPQTERLEIDCNGAGAGFSVASSELELGEIGDLVFPDPAFRQLVSRRPEKLEMEDQPLIHFQVTSFKCGGFALAVSNNHTTFDGLSARMFFDNLGAVAHGGPLSALPCNDRRLLAARSPPRVEFPHLELLRLDPDLPPSQHQATTILDTGVTEIDFKLFRLTGADIAALKSNARAGGGSAHSITSFNVVAAHIWRCKVLATASPPESDERPSKVLFAVDLRQRLRPALPHAYTGNAVLTGYGSASYGELKRGPFARLVEAVREGAARMTDGYARSVIDWGEVHRGFPRGDVMISSWWRLGFAEVEYPWGRPEYSCPVMIPNSEIVVLLPEKKLPGAVNCNASEGVNVCVALPTKSMEDFERHFHSFLSEESEG